MSENPVFVCVRCPLGCEVEVVFGTDGVPESVRGNGCARGRDYALDEAVEPKRSCTAVVAVRGSLEPLSVKTAQPIPRRLMKEILDEIARLDISAPIEAGAIVIDDVCGTGVPVIATKSLA